MRADGAAYPAVLPEVVAETAVVVLRENDRLWRCLSQIAGPLFDKMASTKEEVMTLAAQRYTLLPRLLSGDLQVVETDKTKPVCT